MSRWGSVNCLVMIMLLLVIVVVCVGITGDTANKQLVAALCVMFSKKNKITNN